MKAAWVGLKPAESIGGGGTASNIPSGMAMVGGGGGTRLIFVCECLCLRFDFLVDPAVAWHSRVSETVDVSATEKRASKANARVNAGRLTIMMSP